jgi:hypothetical protein
MTGDAIADLSDVPGRQLQSSKRHQRQHNSAIGGGAIDRSGGKCLLMVKVNNLANEAVQDHIFGDLLRRQVGGEMRLRF